MTADVKAVPDTMTLYQAAAFLTAPTTTHPSFPVIDAARRVVGIIDPPTVIGWRRAGRDRRLTLGELLHGTTVPVAQPDEHLEEVIDRMMTLNVAHLAVIGGDDPALLGYVSWKDLLRVRGRLQQEEMHRGLDRRWIGRRRTKPAESPAE
jgi:CBS domain-containing protein